MNQYGFLNKPSLSQKISPYIKWVIVILLTLALVFGIRSYVNSYSQKEITKNNEIFEKLKSSFEETMRNSSKNSYELTLYGKKLLENNQNAWAIIALTEAVERDPNYRDAAFYTGYAYLKLFEEQKNNINDQFNDLKMEECNDLAKDYLQKASEIDPIYPQTYELLTIVYQNNGDNENAKLCYNKFKDLNKQ